MSAAGKYRGRTNTEGVLIPREYGNSQPIFQSLNKRRENTPPFSKPTFFHEWKEHGIIYHLVWSKSEYLNPKGVNHPVFVQIVQYFLMSFKIMQYLAFF